MLVENNGDWVNNIEDDDFYNNMMNEFINSNIPEVCKVYNDYLSDYGLKLSYIYNDANKY